MKKFLFLVFGLFLILLSLSFVSSLQIEINSNYSLGENFIAKVSGNFYTPLTKDNIYFYRGWLDTSFGTYSLEKIEGDYYISFVIPLEKEAGNYSLEIKGAKYYSGGELIEDNVSKNFDILNKKAFVLVTPPLSKPSEYYYNLTLTNLETKKIDVLYSLEGTSLQTVSLKEGETKKVTLKTYGGNNFEKIIFNYDNLTYSSLVYSSLDQIPIENKTYFNNESINSTNGNETQNNDTRSWWEILFGTGNDKNNSTNNETNETKNNETIQNESNQSDNNDFLDVCIEKNLPVCSSTQECSGSLVDGKVGQCCEGTCIEKKSTNSTWKIIGWVLIGITAIFLLWFFKSKFSKTRMSPGGFFKK
ncbi:hypothetical protein GW931_01810 [archaeon]|nr:hypothetical protein [archaeon]